MARDGFTFRLGDYDEMHHMLRWLRKHNADGGRVRFAGLDVPGSGGSPLPALLQVRDHLATHHPTDAPLADAAIEATAPYRSANNGVAPARHAALSTAERDAATTALARLLLRMDALRPGPDPAAHQTARHNALGALRLDEHLRELSRLGAPEPPATLPSSRDVYQAETVRLLRELHGSDERIVVLLHNAHAQRVPMRLLPQVSMPSAGSYLAADLGTDYIALGVTAHAGSTTDVQLDEAAPQGFSVLPRPLGPPGPDSVERAVADSAPPEAPVLLDLRPARGAPGPTSIRHMYMDTPVDVLTAFDLLACLPTMTPSPTAVRTEP